MARLSDVIELMIRGMLEENNGLVEIARNELANRMKCVPSQINYVISTRFTNQQGYYVESRRGGGGGIRITQIPTNSQNSYLMHLLNSMDAELSELKASLYLKELHANKLISRREAILIESLVSDKVFSEIDVKERLVMRGKMMKNMIACLMVQIK